MTLLDSLIEQGWEVVGYRPRFTDPDGSNPDCYISLRDPNGEVSKVLKSRLDKHYLPSNEQDAPPA